jgi:alkylation response protein AidB-like acyl-CoA dehydrogenase
LSGAIPDAYGGSGLDRVSATILAEKLSGYSSFAVFHGGHAGIGTIPLVYFGTEEQKKKYLPKIAAGDLLSCYCL